MIKFKLKINFKLRELSKSNKIKTITLTNLVKYVILTKNTKSPNIPSNMKYNIHVRDYYKNNTSPSFQDCVNQ